MLGGKEEVLLEADMEKDVWGGLLIAGAAGAMKRMQTQQSNDDGGNGE